MAPAPRFSEGDQPLLLQPSVEPPTASGTEELAYRDMDVRTIWKPEGKKESEEVETRCTQGLAALELGHAF